MTIAMDRGRGASVSFVGVPPSRRDLFAPTPLSVSLASPLTVGPASILRSPTLAAASSTAPRLDRLADLSTLVTPLDTPVTIMAPVVGSPARAGLAQSETPLAPDTPPSAPRFVFPGTVLENTNS
jgi:hypothetical protein